MNVSIKPPNKLGLKNGIGYSMRRYYVDSFYSAHKDEFEAAKNILDLGGVKENKRGQFNLYDHAHHVITLNIDADKGTDIIGDAEHLPLKSDHFDIIICAEVMEHVAEPEAIMLEIARVLKPGGKAYFTAPFLFPIHADPHDYGRYTPTCWNHMLKKAGLSAQEINPQGTFWSVFIDMIRMWIYHKTPNKYLRYGLYALLRPLQALALRKDRNKSAADDKFYGVFTTGFSVIATK